MKPLIDIHTHILPGVDDGADSYAEAVAMLGTARSNGTKGIVLTPHFHPCRPESLGTARLISDRFAEFTEKMAELFPEIKIIGGAENHVGAGQFYEQSAKGALIPIGQTPYALIEFDFEGDEKSARESMDAVCDGGYRPIIAHPERYKFIKEDPTRIEYFIANGALLQINSASIAGRLGAAAKKCAEFFLENEEASFVASDCHDNVFRTPDLSDCYSFVASEYSVNYADVLFIKNPKAVINGEKL